MFVFVQVFMKCWELVDTAKRSGVNKRMGESRRGVPAWYACRGEKKESGAGLLPCSSACRLTEYCELRTYMYPQVHHNKAKFEPRVKVPPMSPSSHLTCRCHHTLQEPYRKLEESRHTRRGYFVNRLVACVLHRTPMPRRFEKETHLPSTL